MRKVDIKSYDSYTDINFIWLHKIPRHWHLDRVKNLTKTQSGTTPPTGLQEYYDAGTNYWVRTTDLNNNRLSKSEYQVTDLALEHFGLRLIPKDSVLIAMYGGMGTIGKNSILENIVTINQSVCAVLPNKKRFHSTYFWYYVQYFRPYWEIFADSARKDPNINQEAIKRLWVNLPPMPEQQAIADYLDTQTAQIDRKIDLLTQKAQKYAELKQSLINETVTHGLDKTVPMKESGVEWVGKIPAGWEVKRLKDIANQSKEKNGINPIGKMLSVSGYRGIEIKQYEDELKMRTSEELADYRVVQIGQLVVNTMWLNYRGIGVSQHRGYVSPAYRAYNLLDSKVYGSFIHYLMRSDLYVAGYIRYLQGIRPNSLQIKTIDFESLPIVIPSINEQKEIANYLDSKAEKIDHIVETINTTIEKLKELRKTLINDVVTGKIKVVDGGG